MAKIAVEAATQLGALKGAQAASAESNYTAAWASVQFVKPDFTKTMIEDAVLGVITDAVHAIASTRQHPERVDFNQNTASLANRASLPGTANSIKVTGVMGRVKDAENGETLLPVSLDRVRSFNRHPAIYDEMATYWYAVDEGAGVIEHTRGNVIIEWPAFERPTFTGDIPLRDWHEWHLVDGVVARLSPKEDIYATLQQGAQQRWNDYLAEIAAVGAAEAQTATQRAAATR